MTQYIKKTTRPSAWILTTLMIISAMLCVHIGATDTATPESDPIYTDNVALLAEKYGALSSIKNQNVITEVGRLVNPYVETYEKKINNIEDSKLYEESTAKTIELYYAQGVAANQIAWIYYSYIGQFDGEAKQAIDRVHNGVHSATEEIDGLQDEISHAANAEDLTERLGLSYNNNGLCARMFVAIYRQKLLMLLEEGDSDAVTEIIKGEQGALVSITKCTNVTAADQYEEIYQKAAEAVMIQRYKDHATAELTELHSFVYPDAELSENEAVQAALAIINAPETVTASAMNEALQGAAEAILTEFAQSEGAYTEAYLNELRTQLSQEVQAANEAESIADISVLFGNFTLELARVNAKDTISADIAAREYADSEEMQALLKKYNVSDEDATAVIDSCMSIEEIAFEIERAKLCADLYGEYVKAADSIVEKIGDGEVKTEAFDRYEYAKAKIEKVDSKQENALEACAVEYDKGLASLGELVVEAEVLAYEAAHNDVLKKDVSEITVGDKEALLAAITELSTLSEEAKETIAAKRTPDDLANKYKAIAKKELESTLGTDSTIRRDNAYLLKEKIDALHVSGDEAKLEELMADADLLAEKAKEIDRVLDRYEQIVSDEGYQSYPEENKTELKELAVSTTASIRDASADADAITKQAQEAILLLDKSEACAVIDAYVAQQTNMTDTTAEAIEEIAKTAKEQISREADPTQLDLIVADATFDMKQELDVQSITEKAHKAIEDVKALEMLTEEQKQNYVNQIEACLEKQIQGIRNADDESAHNSALNTFDKTLTEIAQKASQEDETARAQARADATEELKALHNEAIESIDSMSYLSEAEKEALKAEAEQTLSQGLEQISVAKNATEISAAKNTVIANLNQIAKNGSEQNEKARSTQKTQYNTEIREKASLLIERINQTAYLNEQEKASFKQEVEDTVIEFASLLSAAESLEQLTEAGRQASQRLEQISDSCNERELRYAQDDAVEKITAEERALSELIDSFRFLDDDAKNSLKQKGQATLNEGKEYIADCTTADQVHDKRDAVLDDLAAQKADARVAEDEACVTALTPFMTGLAIACGIEAIALLALWLAYRKKSSMACFVPVMMLAMMPTPLAWTLTVLLSIADVVMAVLIVYLAVKLWRIRKNTPVRFPEPEYETEEPEAEPDNTPIPTTATVPEPKPHGLRARRGLLRLFAPAYRPRLTPKPQLIYLMPPSIPQLLDSVTVEQANNLISDEDAFHCEETNIVNSEVYTGWRKASVNIDVISAAFSEGEVVTLNTLKEKKLISQKVGHVKILGRGCLDKPLTVIAQNFSASAIKMIALTGGTAILTEGSRKRRR
ncbi:MAG: uL15 family ribosomal protein [Clostridia bacterium]|nr:uL15 family ribosomal protein [Clostridia bacterium]